jgi:hypothetical protein
MGIRFFSDRQRPVHMGPYPLERLERAGTMPDLAAVPAMARLNFQRPDRPESLVNAMAEYQAMMDAIRDGLVNKARAEIPDDPRSGEPYQRFRLFFRRLHDRHLRTAQAKRCLPNRSAIPDIDRLATTLKTGRPRRLPPAST